MGFAHSAEASAPLLIEFDDRESAEVYAATVNEVLESVRYETDWWDNVAIVVNGSSSELRPAEALDAVAIWLRRTYGRYEDAPVDDMSVVARGEMSACYLFVCDTLAMSSIVLIVDKKVGAILVRGYSWGHALRRSGVLRGIAPVTVARIEQASETSARVS